MPIIHNQQISPDADDPWLSLPDADPIPPTGDVLVSLPRFLSEADALRSRSAPARFGLWLAPADNVRQLAGLLDGVALITVQFPIFRDGRGYSQASILREMGYRGALRAVGDVLVDQVFFMRRCGFDELALRADKSPDAALRALKAFSFVYAAAPDKQAVVPQLRAAGQPSAVTSGQ